MFDKVIDWIKTLFSRLVGGKKDGSAEFIVDDKTADDIKLWSAMYANAAPWLSDTVKSMNLAAAVASETARLVTVEMKSQITGSARADFLNAAYQPFLDGIRRYTEFAAAKGGVVFKPYVTVDGDIVIDCVQADCFAPINSDESGRMTGGVFVDRIKRGRDYYTRFETHLINENGYTIKNKAYKSNVRDNYGHEIPLYDVPEWGAIEPEVNMTGIYKPMFGYFKMPDANNRTPGSPLGVSVFSRAVEAIKQADMQFSRILWEMESGERAVYVADTAFKLNPNTGKPELPNKRLYRTVSGVSTESNHLFEDYTPDIRVTELKSGLDELLRRVEFNCGLAYGTISDVSVQEKTATEVENAKQRSYAHVAEIQRALKDALDDLIHAMDTLATLYNLAPAGDYETSYEFDDSIITDRKTEFAERLQMLAAGVIKDWEMRMWYLGETETEAKARAAEGAPMFGVSDNANASMA